MKLHNYILLLFLKSISLIFLLVSGSFANEVKNSATVFMYHKLGVSKYPSTSVTIDQLNSHIDELTKEKYSIKSLDFIIDTILNDGDLPENTIGISVDDADKSFLEVGWPLFKKNNIPVTLFVTTGTISNNQKYFVASSHQSIFETFFLQTIFDKPVFILKKELTKIPLFGWYLKKIGSIGEVIDVKRGFARNFLISKKKALFASCLLYTSPSPRDKRQSRMPSSA